ncbi:MAG: hypothetical protein WDZ59_07395 [Pirellulales bacterium]
MHRTAIHLFALLVLLCAGGAHCMGPLPMPFAPAAPAAPHVLPETASLNQVIEAVNRNTDRVSTYTTNNATIGIAGLPSSLSGSIAMERPRRLRLTAGLMGSTEVDLGSNDELFWLWIRRNQPPALYFCRHGQYAHSAARQLIPIEPEWLVEALGLVRFEPGADYRGPTRRRDGAIEMRSARQTELGQVEKLTIIEENQALVLEQHVYIDGQPVASAIASDHRYDPTTGVSLPQRIEIRMPGAPLVPTLTIDVGDVRINQPIGDPQQKWAMPNYPGYSAMDLADPNLRLNLSPAASTHVPTPVPVKRTADRAPAWTRFFRY